MITYRNLTLVDAIEIFKLEQEIFNEEAWSLAQVKEELSGARRKYIAACNNEFHNAPIVGYGGIAIVGDSGDIHTVSVIEDFRRQGIGRRLMARLENWAKDQGVKVFTLEMRVGNSSAAELYRSLGYLEISRRKNYYGDGIDAVVMQKQVSDDQ